MIFYYSPGSCSRASRIALEECGLAYDEVLIDVRAGAQATPDYQAINPWGRVPALAIDGVVLTENSAILSHLADRSPDRGLLPAPGTIDRARAAEWLSLLSSTVHVAFRPISVRNVWLPAASAKRT